MSIPHFAPDYVLLFFMFLWNAARNEKAEALEADEEERPFSRFSFFVFLSCLFCLPPLSLSSQRLPIREE